MSCPFISCINCSTVWQSYFFWRLSFNHNNSISSCHFFILIILILNQSQQVQAQKRLVQKNSLFVYCFSPSSFFSFSQHKSISFVDIRTRNANCSSSTEKCSFSSFSNSFYFHYLLVFCCVLKGFIPIIKKNVILLFVMSLFFTSFSQNQNNLFFFS